MGKPCHQTPHTPHQVRSHGPMFALESLRLFYAFYDVGSQALDPVLTQAQEVQRSCNG